MNKTVNRAVAIFLAVVLGVGMLPATAFAADDTLWTDYAEAISPNAEGVYEIATPAQLAWVAKSINSGSLTQFEYDDNWNAHYKTFRLTANLDLSAHRWVPIGYSNNNKFRAIFDGAGHTISGLRIGTAEAPYESGYYAGLFGRSSGKIYDLSVTDGAIYAQHPEGFVYAGLIVGELDGDTASVTFCNASGEIYIGGTSYYATEAAAGGLVGEMYGGILQNCRATVTLGPLSGDARSRSLGGLVGSATEYRYALVENCVADVTFSSADGSHREIDVLMVSALVGYGPTYELSLRNALGIADLDGIPLDYVQTPGYKQNAVFVDGGGVSRSSEWDSAVQHYVAVDTPLETRTRYYNEYSVLAESVDITTDDFLDALNAVAADYDWDTWSFREDGMPTLSKVGPRMTYTVDFQSFGETLSTALVPDGSPVAAPEAPRREGYTFLWWYADDPETPYDFAARVRGNLTLTAAWNPHGRTVLFDTQGGSYLYPQPVKQDQPIPRPDDPTRKGFLFGGWYTDKDCTLPWDFADGVQGDLTLYAKWLPEGGVSLSGRVTDATTGQAIDGASVALSGGQNALTDALGYYRLNGVAAGEYTVSVTANGYVDEVTAGFLVGDAAAGFDVVLTPEVGEAENTLTVYATVSCVYTALMLKGVTVQAVGEDEQGRPLGPYTGVTDDLGNLIFNRLPAGRYTFTINATGRPGWESYTSEQTDVLSGHYNLECGLKPNYKTLTVTVTGYDPVSDQENVPLAGKKLALTALDPADKTKKLARVNLVTDDNGVAVFTQAVPVTWEIVCADTSYETVTEYVYADAAGNLTRETVPIFLPFINASVTVNLSSDYADPDIFKNASGYTGSDGRRTTFTVQLQGTPGTLSEGIVRETELSSEGEAIFEKLVPGNYTLTASGSVKRYVSVLANDGKEIYSSSEDTRYGPKYFYADFFGNGSAAVALGEQSTATLRVKATPVSFSGTLYKSDMNADGTITTVPLPNTTITVKPSPYYLLSGAAEEGVEIQTDENGAYALTLAPGLYGVTVEDTYQDYFGGHLIYHEGATDTCYYDYNVRGWPCADRWVGTRQAAWAWLSSGDQQPFGDIAGMNLSSGTVVADLELMQKAFRYSLGDATNISFVGIPRTTNAEMHLIVNYEKVEGSYSSETVDYNTESRHATVSMSGERSESLDMTGKRFPASFNALPPGDYDFLYKLGDAFSHLELTTWTNQTRERLPFDGVKSVTFFDFPAPGRLPDADHPFPEDYVDIRYPNDNAKNPWPLQTVADTQVAVSFADGVDGRRNLYDLHDGNAANGELWFKFNNLNRYVERTLDFQPVEVAEGVYVNYGEIELEKMQDDPDTYEDLHEVFPRSGTVRTYSWCPPDQEMEKNREHWDEEFTNGREIWDLLFAYSTSKIPGKLFYLNSMYDEWDKTLIGLPDGTVTLYFCAEKDSWAHDFLIGNGRERRNIEKFPGQNDDLWFAVEVPENGESKEYTVDFARRSGAGNGFRFVTLNEMSSMVHPRNIQVQAVDASDSAVRLSVPVSVTTSDNHTFHSGQVYPDQSCTSTLMGMTVDSDEWECKGYSFITESYDEASNTETFLVPLMKKVYAHRLAITDDAGNPVAGADITIRGESGDLLVLHAGSDGTAQAGEYDYYPDGYRMGGGLLKQGYTVTVSAQGYISERYTLTGEQVVAGATKSVTLQRARQPEFTASKETLDKKGAFLPGVHYDGSSSQLDFVTELGNSSHQFWLEVGAEVTVPEGETLKSLYLMDTRSFALEDSVNSEAVKLHVPATKGESYNPSAVWTWLNGVKKGAYGKVYLQEFPYNVLEESNPFTLDETYAGPGTRYRFTAYVPLWELPIGGFEPCFLAVTSSGAVTAYEIRYGDAAEPASGHNGHTQAAKEQLVGVRLDGDMAEMLNWLASLANLKALGGEAALRGMETLLQHVPVINTAAGTFIPNVTFTADVAEDAEGYLSYTYEIKGELTQGTSISSYANNAYAAYLPTATGLIAIGAWTLSLDGKGRTLDSGYSVEVKGGQLEADNYVPKNLQAAVVNMKDKATGLPKLVVLPLDVMFEVMDPPSGLMTKTDSRTFDQNNQVVERHYTISTAGRVNVKAHLSGFKASTLVAPGVGKVLSLLAEHGALDLGVEARVIAGGNFQLDLAPFFNDHPVAYDPFQIGVGVGVRLGFYAKALGEALVATATVGLSGDNPTPKLNDMVTLTVKPWEKFPLVWIPTEIQGKVNANAHILVRTWFINGEKDFNFDLLTFRYQFNTETHFSLTRIGVADTMQSRDDFTPSTFNGRPETAVDNLLPIGGYAAEESGAFVYTDVAEKGGLVRLRLSPYAGEQTWAEPVTVAETAGLIPAYDLVALDSGDTLVVWTEIDSAHMRETCPPSQVKYALGRVENGTWTGTPQVLDTLPTEVASRLMLAQDENALYLAALRTAEGAIAEHWSVSGYRFDGAAWSEAKPLATNETMSDVAACAAGGALLVSYVSEGTVVTAQWQGDRVTESYLDALPGKLALTASENVAWLVCQTADGLTLYRHGGQWEKVTTAISRQDVGNPALTVSGENLVLTWTANAETGDPETLEGETHHDATLYTAVWNLDGEAIAEEKELKTVTTGHFRDSAALVVENQVVVMSVLDDSTDRLNVYLGDTVTTKAYPKVTGEVSGNTVTYHTENLPDTGAKLLAARYENGRMTAVKLIDSPAETGTITLGGSAESVKLFLLDTGYVPLGRAWGV